MSAAAARRLTAFLSVVLLISQLTIVSVAFHVNVTGGTIQGYSEALFGTYVAKGIPFAAPPVGSLRFLPPQPVQSWAGVRPALNFSAGCMSLCPPNRQNNCAKSVSEDCLYLNVFSPLQLQPTSMSLGEAKTKTEEMTKQASLAVLLWIPGGLFLTCAGSSPAFDGSKLAKTQNVVVVTINYRLGVFGGLYTNSSTRGNFMLQDQRAAMQWVQDNIHVFGGDATRVEIAGESAGAMSVACHLSSPRSWPYFTSAVMSSNPWQHGYLAPASAVQVGRSILAGLGCANTSSPLEELKCLQASPPQVLLQLGMAVLPSFGSFAWAPVVDGQELPVQPLTAATSGLTRPNTPILTGSNSNDTLHIVFSMFAQRNFSHTDVNVTYGVLMYWFGHNETILERLLGLYGNPSLAPDQRLYCERIYTDFNMLCAARGVARSIQTHFPGAPVYHFRFDVVPSFDEYWWNGTTFLSDWSYCIGYSCHSDDVPYDFDSFYAFEAPHAFPFKSLLPAEDEVVSLIQSSWAALAQGKNLSWGSALKTNQTMQISTAQPSEATIGLRSEFCDYFDSIGFARGAGWQY
jgi:carboxylesterase type B